jgi:hypothetical protein
MTLKKRASVRASAFYYPSLIIYGHGAKATKKSGVKKDYGYRPPGKIAATRATRTQNTASLHVSLNWTAKE